MGSGDSLLGEFEYSGNNGVYLVSPFNHGVLSIMQLLRSLSGTDVKDILRFDWAGRMKSCDVNVNINGCLRNRDLNYEALSWRPVNEIDISSSLYIERVSR